MKSALAAPAATPSATASTGPSWLRWLPLGLSLVVLSCALLDRVRANPKLLAAFLGVGGGLVVWQLVLWAVAARTGRALSIEPLPIVRQHVVQASVQSCLYAYWGWWWAPMYAQMPLILVQFAYLYAFDALFSWTRGRPWRPGSGPTPIVLSTNLFIWFVDDWFVWQFAMVSAGLLGKEFLKWTKEGRRTHVFNPSGFGLACAATVLIAADAVDLTWAKSLATTLEVKGIYVFIFGLGLVVQYFFRVTLMTFAACGVMIAIGLAYTQVTGVYLFATTNMPAAAFLGLHLLMTDPSTSPRTNVGRLLFGLGYGIGYVVVFQVLGWIGAPELFAKLFPVPILNCCVQWLDRLARGRALGRLNERWETALSPARTNAIHMAVWSCFFAALLATGHVYAIDPNAHPHPGNSIAFWKKARAEHRHDAERKLIMVAGSHAITRPDEAADALNELGVLSLEGAGRGSEATHLKSAASWFARAMQGGSAAAHENVAMMYLYLGARRSDEDLQRSLNFLRTAARGGGTRALQLLALACEMGSGVPVDGKQALELYRRAGDDLFAKKGIARLGLAPGALVDLAPVAPALAAAAAKGDGESCWYLAYMHELGRGVAKDGAQAKAMFARAAALGFAPAVEAKAKAADGAVPPWQPLRARALPPPPWSTAFP